MLAGLFGRDDDHFRCCVCDAQARELPLARDTQKVDGAGQQSVAAVILLTLGRGVTAALHTASEDHETNSMSFLAVVATVMLLAFILGMILGMRQTEMERQPETKPKEVEEQTLEKEVAPDVVWICRAIGHSYHQDDCPCLWKGGAFQGAKMTRCRRCLPIARARSRTSIAKGPGGG